MPSFLALLLSSILPRVESPWPETVGLDLPFTMAGAGGLFLGLVCFRAESRKRERAINTGGLIGFAGGAFLYLVALMGQLLSLL